MLVHDSGLSRRSGNQQIRKNKQKPSQGLPLQHYLRPDAAAISAVILEGF
jgi:hypothetical protein